MTDQEIKAFIAEKVPEGNSLSKIQDMLKSQGVNITFMELRLIASELEAGLWKKDDAKKEEERAKADQAAAMSRGNAAAMPGASSAGNEEYSSPGAGMGAMAPGMGNGMGRLPEEPSADEDEALPPAGPGEDMPSGEEMPSSGGTQVELSPIARPGAIASGTVKFGSGVTADWVLGRDGRVGLDNPSGSPTQQDIQEFQMELQKLFAR
ncbi:MAG: hypothetical protein IKA79_07665 [Lentisphaeria bacterium]|nr:hypothetical protein [Lentisphaeria bacterium]